MGVFRDKIHCFEFRGKGRKKGEEERGYMI